MKKIQFVQEILNARTLFVQALSVSVINQLKLHNLLCLGLASVHLPYPFHLVFGFQLFGHAVLLCQRPHDQLHAVLCRFVNLSAILSYIHPAICRGFVLRKGRATRHVLLQIYRRVTPRSFLSFSRTAFVTPVVSSSVSVRSSARSSRLNATLFLPGAMPGPR